MFGVGVGVAAVIGVGVGVGVVTVTATPTSPEPESEPESYSSAVGVGVGVGIVPVGVGVGVGVVPVPVPESDSESPVPVVVPTPIPEPESEPESSSIRTSSEFSSTASLSGTTRSVSSVDAKDAVAKNAANNVKRIYKQCRHSELGPGISAHATHRRVHTQCIYCRAVEDRYARNASRSAAPHAQIRRVLASVE